MKPRPIFNGDPTDASALEAFELELREWEAALAKSEREELAQLAAAQEERLRKQDGADLLELVAEAERKARAKESGQPVPSAPRTPAPVNTDDDLLVVLDVAEQEQRANEELERQDMLALVKSAEAKLASVNAPDDEVLLVKANEGPVVLFGRGDPPRGLGNDGEGYIDYLSSNLHGKANGRWVLLQSLSGGGGGGAVAPGATTFLGLLDTPLVYTGDGLDLVRVNAAETGLEFIDPATVGVTDHGALGGLADDDHAQYLLLAGRAGGQVAIGGTAVSEELNLRGTTNANLGLIRCQSPIDFEDVSPANALRANFITARPTQTFTAAFIGGGLDLSPTISYSNAVFIWAGQTIAPRITSLVGPGFAAFTLLNALPVLRGGATGFSPLSSLCLNVGVTMENFGAAVALTTASNIGVAFSPQTRAAAAFATMSVTSQTAVSCRPTFSTIATSVVNMGTVRGLHCQIPAVALFQPAAGTETLAAYYGIDFDNITFVSTGDKVVVRSAMTAAADRYFLQNNGGAQSDFGGGFILDAGLVQILSDTLGISMGAAGGDIQLLWNGSALEYDPLVGEELTLAFSVAATRPTYVWEAESLGVSETAYTEARFGFDRMQFGAVGAIGNQVFNFQSPSRTVAVGGGWADVLLTQAGNLDINGLAMSDVSAWVINAISLDALGGGSIGDIATLRVGGMTTSLIGAADTASLFVTGRRTQRGTDNFLEITAAALAANVNNYGAQLTGNAMREMVRVSSDDLGVRTITGFAIQQTGDTITVINVGTVDNILLTHEDAGSTATNRIISPTAATWTLAPSEFAKLWHDPVTDRWRILESNGA